MPFVKRTHHLDHIKAEVSNFDQYFEHDPCPGFRIQRKQMELLMTVKFQTLLLFLLKQSGRSALHWPRDVHSVSAVPFSRKPSPHVDVQREPTLNSPCGSTQRKEPWSVEFRAGHLLAEGWRERKERKKRKKQWEGMLWRRAVWVSGWTRPLGAEAVEYQTKADKNFQSKKSANRTQSRNSRV